MPSAAGSSGRPRGALGEIRWRRDRFLGIGGERFEMGDDLSPAVGAQLGALVARMATRIGRHSHVPDRAGSVTAIDPEGATVLLGGRERRASTLVVPEVAVGDW